MGNGFYHKDLIDTLGKNFVKEFNKYISTSLQKSVSWKFPDRDFEHAYTSGLGPTQVKVIDTEFVIERRRIPISFMEDFKGNLTVMVNHSSIYVVKPMEGVSKNLLKALANAIKDAI